MKSSKLKCECEICKNGLKNQLTESDLHEYVGVNKSNSKCDLHKFEKGLMYSAVTHWDVGYTEYPRYFVYLDTHGNAVAWYDGVNHLGFK